MRPLLRFGLLDLGESGVQVERFAVDLAVQSSDLKMMLDLEVGVGEGL